MDKILPFFANSCIDVKKGFPEGSHFERFSLYDIITRLIIAFPQEGDIYTWGITKREYQAPHF